ncbi:alpha/beta fold hydrolase [bacterium]|nr:alpha/beta fold hydrolase [bacterium]
MQSKLISLGQGTVHLKSASDGFPLVLLHGGGIDSATLSWSMSFDFFAKHFHVLAPDWPGYGRSDPLPGDSAGIPALVDVLGEMLQILNLPKVHLVGISMGGGAALGYTLAHPDRVAKLVLVDSYGLAAQAPFHRLSYLATRVPVLSRTAYATMRRSRTLTRWGVRSIFAGPVPEDVVQDSFVELQLPHAGEPFIAFQRAEVAPDRLRTCYMDRLSELTNPVLLIHGDKDMLVPLSAAKEAARRLPNARLEIFKETGHWSTRERPELFNQCTLDFLRGT